MLIMPITRIIVKIFSSLRKYATPKGVQGIGGEILSTNISSLTGFNRIATFSYAQHACIICHSHENGNPPLLVIPADAGIHLPIFYHNTKWIPDIPVTYLFIPGFGNDIFFDFLFVY